MIDLARLSLVLTAMLASAGCLITSSPELEPPEQTRPQLLAGTADPDLRQMVVAEDGRRVTFSAGLLSEDNGEDVQVVLYLNYGTLNDRGQPFLRDARYSEVAASTLDDTSRRATAEWVPTVDPFPPGSGCNTMTLMVSHAFDSSGCPRRLSDSDHITWFVLQCQPGEVCPPPVDDPRLDCPVPEVSCPEVSGEEPAQ